MKNQQQLKIQSKSKPQSQNLPLQQNKQQNVQNQAPIQANQHNINTSQSQENQQNIQDQQDELKLQQDIIKDFMREKLQRENQKKFYQQYFNERTNVNRYDGDAQQNQNLKGIRNNSTQQNSEMIRDQDLAEQLYSLSTSVKGVQNNLNEDAQFIENGMSSLLKIVDTALINMKMKTNIASLIIKRDRSNSKERSQSNNTRNLANQDNQQESQSISKIQQQPKHNFQNRSSSQLGQAQNQSQVQKQVSASIQKQIPKQLPIEKKSYNKLQNSETQLKAQTTSKKQSLPNINSYQYSNNMNGQIFIQENEPQFLQNEMLSPIPNVDYSQPNINYQDYDQQTLNLSNNSPGQNHQQLRNNVPQSSSTQMLYNGSFSDLGIPISNTASKQMGQVGMMNAKTRNGHHDRNFTAQDGFSNQHVASMIQTISTVEGNGNQIDLNNFMRNSVESVEQIMNMNNQSINQYRDVEDEESLMTKLQKTIKQKKQMQKSQSTTIGQSVGSRQNGDQSQRNVQKQAKIFK